MFLGILRKEILLSVVSFRFVISVALLFVLIVGSLQIMAINYTRRVDDFESSTATHKENLRNMATLMDFIGFGVAKDPRPPLLGIFAVGLDQKMSSSFMVPGYNILDMQGLHSPAYFERFSEMTGMEMEGSKYANPIFTLFQPPDFIYVINVVLSLFAILFAFDCISGEKEDQTLKLMLANSVPRDIVLFAKWLGGTLTILAPFAVSFGLGLLLVAARPGISFAGEAPMRILLIFMTSAIYIGVFFLIGLVCSTFTERSATSLIVALFVWVFFVLVVPNIAPVVARQLKPLSTPDQVAYSLELKNRELAKKLEKSEDKSDKFKDELKDEMQQYVKINETEWQNRLAAQTKLAMNISRISPSANFVYASTHIAGTGIEDFQGFKQDIVRYRDMLKNVDKKKLYDFDSTKPFPPQMFIKMNIEEVPEFTIKQKSIEDSINFSLIDIGILIMYMILLFMASFVGFLRYDVK